jgi:hypothetical protein
MDRRGGPVAKGDAGGAAAIGEMGCRSVTPPPHVACGDRTGAAGPYACW